MLAPTMTRLDRRWPVSAARDREILRLAVPAFLALVAEPLFLLSDAAIVGHLGAAELAGLGIAAVVLQTAVGLCVFLAYGTTASVARQLGAGDLRGALAQGVDGLWLAVGIGAGRDGRRGRRSPVRWSPRSAPVRGSPSPAETYLRIAFLGTVPLLVMLAATGVLRGLQDTRTPLVRRGRRQRAQHRAQPGARLPRRPRHRRLRPRLGAGPGRERRGRSSSWWSAPPAGTAPRCAPTCPASARAAHAGVAARGPHPHPARGAAGHDVRRHRRRRRAASRRSTWPPTSSR